MSLDLPSKLDALGAVNFMLQQSGERRVSRLKETVSAVKAEEMLVYASSEVQDQEWNFTTSRDVSLIRDTEGRVPVSQDITAVFPAGSFVGSDWIIRDGYLFDRRNASFVFSSSPTADVTRNYEFDQLPRQFARLITLRATIAYLEGEKPDSPNITILSRAEARATVAARAYDDRLADNNLVSTNNHFWRHRNPRSR